MRGSQRNFSSGKEGCSPRSKRFPPKPVRDGERRAGLDKAQPGITAPIASATSLDQARELVAALKLDLSPAQIERLSQASA